MNAIELTLEKSQELASIIEMLKPALYLLDMEYATAAYNQMKDQASWQESAAVLNPNYNPEKNNALKEGAKALSLIIQLKETLINCDTIKKRASEYDSKMNRIKSLFI